MKEELRGKARSDDAINEEAKNPNDHETTTGEEDTRMEGQEEEYEKDPDSTDGVLDNERVDKSNKLGKNGEEESKSSDDNKKSIVTTIHK